MENMESIKIEKINPVKINSIKSNLSKIKIGTINVNKIMKGMLIPSLIVMSILSVQTDENAIKASISIYSFMVCLVGYLYFNGEVINKISALGKFMKNLTIIIIVLTMIGMILNLSINYDKISGNKMPNSYYNFSMLINLFISIQIMIVFSNLLYGNGNLYTLSDKMTMISIFFGLLGFMMLAILISITIYNYTQG
jgi:hypothetical protein